MVPRDAATLVLVRDASDGGIEVLMLRRSPGLPFAGGAHVFPGGALDPEDAGASARVAGGRGDAQASAILGVERGGLAFWVAAVRECFEEAGVLLARPAAGEEERAGRGNTGLQDRLRLARAEMAAGRATLERTCEAEDLVLDTERIYYFSHWLTPRGAPRRYDTRFFVAAAPGDQRPEPDGRETVSSLWIAPGEALAAHHRGEIELIVPTAMTLQALDRFPTTGELLAAAESAEREPAEVPRMGPDEEGVRISLPGDGLDTTSRVGQPTSVARGVRRVLAPNPSMMTGPGTNTYLVGTEDLAVIDPGPADEAHLDAVAAAGGGRVRWILTTHTHPDHAPGAEGLRARTGARVAGFCERDSFVPDTTLGDGDVVTGPGWSLRAIHTPGHASNHLCYLLEGSGLLFSGDHVMDGSTVVISPPDGDMTAYLESLDRLLQLRPPLAAIAPGHGQTITDPQGRVKEYVSHRLERERLVAEALRAAGPATVGELVPTVYADVGADRHEVAAKSLWAHLRRLAELGSAMADDPDDIETRWSSAT